MVPDLSGINLFPSIHRYNIPIWLRSCVPNEFPANSLSYIYGHKLDLKHLDCARRDVLLCYTRNEVLCDKLHDCSPSTEHANCAVCPWKAFIMQASSVMQNRCIFVLRLPVKSTNNPYYQVFFPFTSCYFDSMLQYTLIIPIL